MVPGFEGIFHTKYLRRIKVVDRYYMNYNDYGHLDQDPKVAALEYQIGPKSVITFPSGGHQLPGRGFYEISGLAWSGGGAIRKVEVSTDGGKRWNTAEIKGTAQRMAHARFTSSVELGRTRDRASFALHGRDRSGSTVARTGRQVLEQALRCHIQRAGAGQQHSTLEDRHGRERDQWVRVGFSVAFALLMGVSALAQAPTYGVGRTPSAEEIRAWDISIGPTGEELPPGRGTAKEGAQVYRAKCAGCHGATGIEGKAPIHEKQGRPGCRALGTGTNTAASLAVRDDGLGLHQSRHASQS